MSVGYANLILSKGNQMFSTQDQKTRRAYAEYWGIEIGDVYYCEICETWTNDDEDGYPSCLCA